MPYKALRCAVLMIVLASPLGGCLEVLGSRMNRGPTAPEDRVCRQGAQSAGETIGYGCPPTTPTPG